MTAAAHQRAEDRKLVDEPTATAARSASSDGPCVTCHVRLGRKRPTRLHTVVCGPCWAAHGGKPDAAEIGPEPAETAPLRYPSGQRHWTSALKRAEWVQDIRIHGRNNLLAIAQHLARAADWTTLESWPGWDTLMAKTGRSERTVQRWLQELKLRGWIVVVETGSTPLTRPMALTLPDGRALSRDEGNRRAVYALRIPLSPNEALRWAAEQIAAQAEREAAEAAERAAAELRARMVTRVRGLLAKAASTAYDCERVALTERAQALIGEHQLTPAELTDPDVEAAEQRLRVGHLAYMRSLWDDPAEQGKPASAGDEKAWPTWSFPAREKTGQGGYAREGTVVDDLGMPVSDPWEGNDQTSALRAHSNEEGAGAWACRVPTTRFQMLLAADWLRRTLTIFARLSRKAVRAACRPYWRAGWSNLDIVHAMDHLPSAFGPRAGTPIGRGPADALDRIGCWWWIKTRLEAWRDPDGRVRPGYYQTRGRRKAMRQAIAQRYGRAGLAVLRAAGEDPDVVDPVLTPGKIAAFGRRVAEQLRRRPDPPPAPRAPVTAGQPNRGRELVDQALADKRAAAAAAAERRAALMTQLGIDLAGVRAELATRTAAAASVDSAVLADNDALSPEQIHERARAKAAGYRRGRRRPGR